MSDRSDVPVARAIRARWSGIADELVGFLADDVEWWEIGFTEPIRGKTGATDHLRKNTDIEIAADVHDVLANDEHIVALIHAKASKAGSAFTYSIAEVYHVNASGRITKRQAFAPNTYPIARFFRSSQS